MSIDKGYKGSEVRPECLHASALRRVEGPLHGAQQSRVGTTQAAVERGGEARAGTRAAGAANNAEAQRATEANRTATKDTTASRAQAQQRKQATHGPSRAKAEAANRSEPN